MDKEARAWDVFNGLDADVKNMMTSLRAVAELQNPAIRDRHWHELMRATKVNAGKLIVLAKNNNNKYCEVIYDCSTGCNETVTPLKR